jgi:hypothetical protein
MIFLVASAGSVAVKVVDRENAQVHRRCGTLCQARAGCGEAERAERGD